MSKSMIQPEVTLRKILHASILTCAPDTPIPEAAMRMVEQQCSSILIENEGKIVGIWTEQDALAVNLSDPAIFHVPISQVMSSPVKSIGIDTRISIAALRFRDEKIRHLLVVDPSGVPKGIVSQTDIVIHQGLDYYLTLREVKSVFNQAFFRCPGTALAQDAIHEMQQKRLNAIIIENPGNVYGILTERDVVRLISRRSRGTTAGELASFPLITVPADSSVYQARKCFLENKIRHLGVTDDDGQLIGLLAFSDILANIESEYVRKMREALNERDEMLAVSNRQLRLAATAFENTFEAIVVTNADKVIESVNPAFTVMTGYSAHEVIGKTPSILSSGRHDNLFYQAMHEQLATTGHWQGEIWNKRRNGEIFVEWLNINAVTDEAGKIGNYVAVFSDITNRKAAEEQMRFLAQHDVLTSLPNRALLGNRLMHAIAHAERSGKKLAVIFLDLNDFKIVNDSFGHHAGDQMLQTVAQRLTGCVRAGDTVARLGGDEFVVVIEDLGGENGVTPIAEKIVYCLAQPMSIEGQDMRISTSIGISLYPDHGAEPDQLLRNADMAMYQAKADGPNRFHFFDQDSNN